MPITGESAEMSPLDTSGKMSSGGDDRVFIVVRVGDETPDPAVLGRAKASGAPVVTIQLHDVYALGGEFLRWEVATATAGLLMEINPFDEPNVQAGEGCHALLLEIYEQSKRLPLPEPHAEIGGVRLTLSEAAQAALNGEPATHSCA